MNLIKNKVIMLFVVLIIFGLCFAVNITTKKQTDWENDLNKAYNNICSNTEVSEKHFILAAKSGALAAKLFLIHLYGEGIMGKIEHLKAEKIMLEISDYMKEKILLKRLRLSKKILTG